MATRSTSPHLLTRRASGLAASFLVLCGFADSPRQGTEAPAALVAALKAQADRWDEAIVRKDRAAIEANMAEDFRQIDGAGNVATKKSFVDEIVSPNLEIDPYEVEDFDVRVYGEVALLSGRTRMTGRFQGKPFASHYRFIDVYVRSGGEWNVVNVQISRIPSEAPPPARAPAQERLFLSTRDGAILDAHVYGGGPHGVVLVHGGRFTKESWHEQARILVEAGFRVLALDLRGFGQSQGNDGTSAPTEKARELDVLAAVEHLRQNGATTVSVVGASMGGDYAAEAAEAHPDEIDRLVLLAAGAYTPLVRSKARKLFILSRDDVIGDNTPRLPAIQSQYEKASEPKELVVLDGSAHAQFLFATDQGERLMQEILRFLSAP